ncbi:MAG: DUF3899 domain-containing protein [Clostridiales bacterium]|nr:DUF3899 domain-containing protein [Clostridiales bacterium]
MKRMGSFLLKYGITAAVGGLLTWLTLDLHGFSSALPKLEQYRLLCDAFTIPGIILVMVGFLVMISNAGNFLGLGYAAKHAVKMLIPFGNKKDERYYDYYQRKQEQGKVKGYGFIFITGLAFMMVAITFFILFYSNR